MSGLSRRGLLRGVLGVAALSFFGWKATMADPVSEPFSWGRMMREMGDSLWETRADWIDGGGFIIPESYDAGQAT